MLKQYLNLQQMNFSPTKDTLVHSFLTQVKLVHPKNKTIRSFLHQHKSKAGSRQGIQISLVSGFLELHGGSS